MGRTCFFPLFATSKKWVIASPLLLGKIECFSVAIDLRFSLKLQDRVRIENTVLGMRIKTMQGWDLRGVEDG